MMVWIPALWRFCVVSVVLFSATTFIPAIVRAMVEPGDRWGGGKSRIGPRHLIHFHTQDEGTLYGPVYMSFKWKLFKDYGLQFTPMLVHPYMMRQIWDSYKYINEGFDSHEKWAPLFYNAKTGGMIRGPTSWESFRNCAIGISPHAYGEVPDLMKPDSERFSTEGATPLKLVKDTIGYGPEWTRGLPGPLSDSIESLGIMGKQTINKWRYKFREGKKELCQFFERSPVHFGAKTTKS